MAIVPDDKNWTWVLERPCDECGFRAGSYPRERLGDAVLAIAARWLPVLRRSDVAVRPNDSTWSPLEYGAHVRDVFRLYDLRLARMLNEDGPRYANWDQDVTAVAERYNEQDPTVVAMQLIGAAEVLAARFRAVADGEWSHTGYRSDGAAFTVESLGVYMVHDPLHHLHDVRG
jgi:hypothetical protein